MTDETLPPPFGELSRKEKEALVVGYHCDGKAVQYWISGCPGGWVSLNSSAGFFADTRYRLAPEPEIPDSIDWDHVADEFDRMEREGDDIAWLTGSGYVEAVTPFASYKRGNMPSCTVRRPK